MHAGDWIALASVVITLGGLGVKAIATLTRLAVAVEDLKKTMPDVVGKLEDHEHRITAGGL